MAEEEVGVMCCRVQVAVYRLRLWQTSTCNLQPATFPYLKSLGTNSDKYTLQFVQV